MASLSNLTNSNNKHENYEILEKLSEGSCGSLWKAIHKSTGNYVTLKKEKTYPSYNDILQDCKNPYIAAYHGSYVTNDNKWTVVEYSETGSVAEVIKKNKVSLSENQIAVICRDVLHGLVYFHGIRKIYHEIRCENIIITNNGVSKLASYAISTDTQDRYNYPFWMAPEAIENMGGSKMDIWSLGITCIEMAEMNPPYYDKTAISVLFNIVSDPPPCLTHPDQWSSEFNDFINKTLIKEPENRPSARELLEHPFILLKADPSRKVLEPLIGKKDEIIISNVGDYEPLEISHSSPANQAKIISQIARDHLSTKSKDYPRHVVPEDFIENCFTLSTEEKAYLSKYFIFTMRQLAAFEIDDDSFGEWIQAFKKDRLQMMQDVAKESVAESIFNKLKISNDPNHARKGYGYAYVSEAIRNMIVNQNRYKSPHVLFNEYLECTTEEQKLDHPWKSIYSKYKLEVSKHLNKTPTDLDVYSYLIWRTANFTEGQLDLSIGTRAIPCAWTWIPSNYYEIIKEKDKIKTTELQQPETDDRYKYPMILNLADLVNKHGATLYRVECGNKKWIPTTLEYVSKWQYDINLWNDFNPEDNYENSVSHCIIVMPDGIIPASCIKMVDQFTTRQNDRI